ncbi:MAG TPA: hypothetical protein GXX54_02435 [Clostridiales bacterium]|nr:hypothetical protein [Clostridiales bacterium]
MRLKYYGTGAAEGIPGLFCDCDVCNYARAHRGKDIRTRSQAAIDDKLLIDFPPDTYMHVLYGGLNLSKIHSCIVTHNHSDHLYPADIEMRRNGFAYPEVDSPLTFYCSPKTSEGIKEMLQKYELEKQNRVLCEVIEPYRPYNIEGYTVIALEANHDQRCEPYFYIISDGKSSMVYGNDTGYFPDRAWEYLENNKIVFSYVSLDCTAMDLKGWRNHHMSLDVCAEVKERLVSIGCADKNTIWCIHHFSHNGLLNHSKLEEAAASYGFLVSYDGMEVEF